MVKKEKKCKACTPIDRSCRRIFCGQHRVFFLLILWLSFYIFACYSRSSEPLELRVMTFNIRFDNPADGQQAWPFRRQIVADLIRLQGVDLLGTQEMLENQLDDLLRQLPEYGYIGVGREDGQTAGEYSAILFRRDRLEAEKSGTFWLSQTPEIPGSKGWDAACERIVTWAIFRLPSERLRLAFFNTHFDHVGETARRESAHLLVNRIREIAGDLPTILSGDLNATPDSETLRIILASGRLSDSRASAALVSGPSWSFHGFGRLPEDQRSLIDYILVSQHFAVMEYRNIFEEIDGTYYSDHNPVLVKLKIRRR